MKEFFLYDFLIDNLGEYDKIRRIGSGSLKMKKGGAMGYVIPWFRKKISKRVHHGFLKIVFVLGVIGVGLELAPIVSYMLMRYSMVPQEVWQKIVLVFSYFRMTR